MGTLQPTHLVCPQPQPPAAQEEERCLPPVKVAPDTGGLAHSFIALSSSLSLHSLVSRCSALRGWLCGDIVICHKTVSPTGRSTKPRLKSARLVFVSGHLLYSYRPVYLYGHEHQHGRPVRLPRARHSLLPPPVILAPVLLAPLPQPHPLALAQQLPKARRLRAAQVRQP